MGERLVSGEMSDQADGATPEKPEQPASGTTDDDSAITPLDRTIRTLYEANETHPLDAIEQE